jgi:hypothetical protein
MYIDSLSLETPGNVVIWALVHCDWYSYNKKMPPHEDRKNATYDKGAGVMQQQARNAHHLQKPGRM